MNNTGGKREDNQIGSKNERKNKNGSSSASKDVVEISDNDQPDTYDSNLAEDNSDNSQTVDPGEEGSEKFKVFVGRLVNDITTDELKNYFSKFGEVIDVMLVHDNFTHKFRGFAFVRFSTLQMVNDVLNTTDHSINGRAVDVKPATAKGGPKSLPSEDVEPNKIFVGGFSPEITKEQLVEIFSQFGSVVDVNIITETQTNKSRGFCYITFENDESRKNAVTKHKVLVGDANAEIKNAIPKELQNRLAPPRRGDRFPSKFRRGGNSSRGGRGSDRNRRLPERDDYYNRYDQRDYDRYYPPYERDYPYQRDYSFYDRGRDYPPYERPPQRFGQPRRGGYNSPQGSNYRRNKGQDEYYSYYQKQQNTANKSGTSFNKRNNPPQ